MIRDSEGNEYASGVTDEFGVFSVDIDAPGEFTIEVEKEGEVSVSRNIDAECTNNTTIVYLGSYMIVTVGGCACPLDGALVRVEQTVGGSDVFELLTDSDGTAYIPFVPIFNNTYKVTVSYSLYITQELFYGVNDPSVCNPVLSFNLESVPGYFCYGDCRDPLPDSLTVTLSNHPALFGQMAGKTKTVTFDRESVTVTGLGGFLRAYLYSWCGMQVEADGLFYGVFVHIDNVDCGIPSAYVNVTSFATAPCGIPSGAQTYTHTINSGSAACPVAFTATRNVFPPVNSVATVSQ
jgi:hypothetical protein